MTSSPEIRMLPVNGAAVDLQLDAASPALIERDVERGRSPRDRIGWTLFSAAILPIAVAACSTWRASAEDDPIWIVLGVLLALLSFAFLSFGLLVLADQRQSAIGRALVSLGVIIA